ncbi:GDP-L-fucose synthase 2 [Micractinium conductrix]|uniref:GDP-L-fucose synthase 2 n=1 Tax=Micractinium conductrix TaxID=554055 RepID=A0A2P6V393_9CHLO|nr:GDP-L-fucose synthase 2 [Micractinium conductrix]|eukprot:PSC68563.1 GDP-L-fucose synthase 2 [Micractinium conductrix]
MRLVTRYPNCKIIVLDKLEPCSSLRGLEGPGGVRPPNLRFVKGSILEADLLLYVLASDRIDSVLHFAAQTHVDASFGNSLTFTLNNTYGTHVLLEACRAYGGVRRFVYVSTDEVHGDSNAGLLLPTNPYAAAKAGAELMAQAYAASFGLPVIIARANNVYGPGQFPEKLVPRFVMLAARGAPLPVHGEGCATRAYLFVDDVAEAFELILLKGEVGQTYAIGSERQRSVLEVAADVLALHAAPPAGQLAHVRDRAFNDRRHFVKDAQLEALGWRERTPWGEGLRRTVEWYRRHASDWWEPVHVEAALKAHLPGQPLVAYANEATLTQLGGGDAGQGLQAASAALALIGGRLEAVPNRRQAADAALKRDLQAWARAHGRAGALACLSNDVGFAAALRHAREASGCKTVAVTDPLFTRPRPSWASPPDYGRYPLPAAAGRCLVWNARLKPPCTADAAEEARLLAAAAAAAGLPLPDRPCEGGVAAAWVLAPKPLKLRRLGGGRLVSC